MQEWAPFLNIVEIKKIIAPTTSNLSQVYDQMSPSLTKYHQWLVIGKGGGMAS